MKIKEIQTPIYQLELDRTELDMLDEVCRCSSVPGSGAIYSTLHRYIKELKGT